MNHAPQTIAARGAKSKFLTLRSLPGPARLQSWGVSPPSLSYFVSGRFATFFITQKARIHCGARFFALR
jgi:hypothetical protein